MAVRGAAPLVLLFACHVALSAQDPGSSGKQLLLEGRELFLTGEYERATAVLQRALEALEDGGDRVDARRTLALIHQTEGNDERAIVEFQWI